MASEKPRLTGLDRGEPPGDPLFRQKRRPDSSAGKTGRALSQSQAARAIFNAAVPGCQRFRNIWAIDTKDLQAFGMRCKRWDCKYCSRIKHLAAYSSLAHGIAVSSAAGKRTRFLTLTDTSAGEMNSADLYKNFTKLKKRMHREGYLGEYAACLEVQTRGALHLHVLLADSERGGGFIDQKTLGPHITGSGFGEIYKLIALEETSTKPLENLAYYCLKDHNVIPQAQEMIQKVARYCSKSKAEALRNKSGYRLRPFRVSRGWPGGGLRDAETAILNHWFPPEERTKSFEIWKSSEVGANLDRLAAMKRASEIIARQNEENLETCAFRLLTSERKAA